MPSILNPEGTEGRARFVARFDPPVWNLLRHVADRDSISMNAIVNDAVARYLMGWGPEDTIPASVRAYPETRAETAAVLRGARRGRSTLRRAAERSAERQAADLQAALRTVAQTGTGTRTVTTNVTQHATANGHATAATVIVHWAHPETGATACGRERPAHVHEQTNDVLATCPRCSGSVPADYVPCYERIAETPPVFAARERHEREPNP